jgi:rod shape determining protein RodA
MFKNLLKQDYTLTFLVIILTILGIISIYSTGQSYEGSRQIIFAIVGIIAYFSLLSVDYRIYKDKKVQILIYAVIIIMLGLIFLLNIRLNNTRRWFVIGKFDIQPAEFAKIVVILISASFFEVFRKTENALKKIALGFLIIVPIVYLIYKQPALGNTIIILVIWFAIVFASYYDQKKFIYIISIFILSILLILPFIGINFLNANLNLIFFNVNILLLIIILGLIFLLYKKASKNIYKYILFITIILGIFVGFSFKLIVWDHLLKNYQKNRLIGFIDQSSKLNSSINFQTEQSKIAIGSGGLWGKGYLEGTQSRLNFLPEDTTDFIFATIVEEFGLIGTLILLSLYLAFIYRIIHILKNTRGRYETLIVIGVLTMIMIQFIINVGMNLGVMPVTGITLPLISYGGSSLLTILICLGILQNIYIQRKNY